MWHIDAIRQSIGTTRPILVGTVCVFAYLGSRFYASFKRRTSTIERIVIYFNRRVANRTDFTLCHRVNGRRRRPIKILVHESRGGLSDRWPNIPLNKMSIYLYLKWFGFIHKSWTLVGKLLGSVHQSSIWCQFSAQRG